MALERLAWRGERPVLCLTGDCGRGRALPHLPLCFHPQVTCWNLRLLLCRVRGNSPLSAKRPGQKPVSGGSPRGLLRHGPRPWGSGAGGEALGGFRSLWPRDCLCSRFLHCPFLWRRAGSTAGRGWARGVRGGAGHGRPSPGPSLILQPQAGSVPAHLGGGSGSSRREC